MPIVGMSVDITPLHSGSLLGLRSVEENDFSQEGKPKWTEH